VTIDAARRTLMFDWVESGGPAVTPPKREGFGSRLLAFVLRGQIQARITINYDPVGVRVRCTLPLPANDPSGANL
jgi:two-component sensor histidine kinase